MVETEVILKSVDGKELMRVFVSHSSLDELRSKISDAYELKYNANSPDWRLPLSEPVDGTGRELSSDLGYDNWKKNCPRSKLVAYEEMLGESDRPRVRGPSHGQVLYLKRLFRNWF